MAAKPATLPLAVKKPVSLLPIFLIVLVDVFGLTLVFPLLTIYAEHFQATPLQATLLVSVYAGCQLVSGPLLGQFSDRFGRKPMLLISQVGTFFGFLLLGQATTLWMIYVSRVIDGSTAGNLSLAQAYIADHTEPKDRARSFGLIGVAFGLGFFIGPFLTGYLVHYSLAAPIYLAAGMSLTSILCTLFLLDGGPPPQPEGIGLGLTKDGAGPGPGGKRLSVLQFGKYTQYFSRPVLGGLLFQYFCYVLCFSIFTSGFALFAERTFHYHGHPFTPREIGYLFAYVGLLGIFLQGGLIGRLVKRLGEAPLISAGFLALVAGYVGLGLCHKVTPLLVVSTISAFGNGVLRPTLTSLITQRAGRSEQGVVLGLTQSLQSVAAIIAPIGVGLLIQHGHLRLWAFLAASAAAVGLLAARRGSGREDHGALREAAGAPNQPTDLLSHRRDLSSHRGDLKNQSSDWKNQPGD